MAKLQKITRSNGSHAYSVNIPIDIVEETGWQKGENLSLERKEDNSIVIKAEKEE